MRKILSTNHSHPLGRVIDGHPLAVRATRGTVWSAVATASSQAQLLVVSLLVARALGPTGFGRFVLVSSTASFMGIFAAMGLGMTATKYAAQLRHRDGEAAGEILGLAIAITAMSSVIVAVAVEVAAASIATRIFHDPGVALPLRIAAGGIVFASLSATVLGALVGLEEFGHVAWISAVVNALTVTFVFGVSKAWGLNGVFASLAVGSGLSAFLGWTILRQQSAHQRIRVKYWRWQARWRVLLDFSIPALLASAVVVPATWYANLLLARQGGGLHQLALFGAANQWRAALAFVPAVLAQVSLPMLASLQEDASGYKRVVVANAAAAFGVCVIAAAAVALAARPILVAYGPSFTEGIPVMWILLGAGVINSTVNVAGTAIASLGRMWDGLALNTVWLASFLISLSFLASSGAIGVAFAYLASYVIHLLSVTLYLTLFIPHRLVVGGIGDAQETIRA